MMKLKAPDNCSSCSFDGNTYEVVDGHVNVPMEATDLFNHGFTLVGQSDKPEGDKPEGDKPEGDKPEGDKPEGNKS